MIEWIRKFFAIICQMECEIFKFKALNTVWTHTSKSFRQVKATIEEMEKENSTFQKPKQNKAEQSWKRPRILFYHNWSADKGGHGVYLGSCWCKIVSIYVFWCRRQPLLLEALFLLAHPLCKNLSNLHMT